MAKRSPGSQCRIVALLLAILALAATSTRADERCRLDDKTAARSWTEIERWAWGEICEGRRANLKEPPSSLRPDVGEVPKERRRLSARFLEAVLLDEPFRNLLSRRRVEIVGAWFPENVQFFAAQIDFELWLND
jgi:hypothetical protein